MNGLRNANTAKPIFFAHYFYLVAHIFRWRIIKDDEFIVIFEEFFECVILNFYKIRAIMTVRHKQYCGLGSAYTEYEKRCYFFYHDYAPFVCYVTISKN